MQKNGVKVQQRMDSKQEDFLNLRLNLSLTRSMINPLLAIDIRRTGIGDQIGLVLMQKVVNGLTQAVHLNWNFKIGAQVIHIVIQVVALKMRTVSHPIT